MHKISNLYDCLMSLHCASLLHGYGLLDEFIASGNRELSDDYYEIYYDVISLAADFKAFDYIECFELEKSYFSNKSMLEYYKLCRQYGSAHGMKLKDNPYMKAAEKFVNSALNLGGMGYDWILQTKVNHEWASGIVFITDWNYNCSFELLEALLEIREWYTYAVIRLRGKLLEEGVIALPALPAAKEAQRI